MSYALCFYSALPVGAIAERTGRSASAVTLAARDLKADAAHEAHLAAVLQLLAARLNPARVVREQLQSRIGGRCGPTKSAKLKTKYTVRSKYALDTVTAIRILNDSAPQAKKRTEEVGYVALPMAVVAELLFGAMNSRRRDENLAHCETFVGNAVKL